jgi:hypothetical protein
MSGTEVLDQPTIVRFAPEGTARGFSAREAARAAAPWGSATIGAVLLTGSYSLAQTRGVDATHYLVFWLGMLAMSIPAVVVAGARRTADHTRHVWVLAYAFFTFLPKLLRNPSAPLFHDEIAHWRQATNLAANGRLFQPDPLIGIIGRFPGLHILVASVSDATGLTVWQSAVTVLVGAHLAAMLGAFALGEAVLGTMRAGAVVALIYSFNSSFLYFDTQLGYESLAIVFFIWCLACLARMQRGKTARQRRAWTAAAVVLGCGVVPIHHLTALVLVLALGVISVATALRRRAPGFAEALGPTLAVTAAVAAAAGLWIGLVAPATVGYLSPYFGGGLSQLTRLFSGSGGGRTLFSASTEPSYERLAAFVSPLLAGAFAFAGIVRRRHRVRRFGPWTPMRTGLSLFGLLYFPSVPFILVSSGAEGARRSWAFTYLGLAVLVTPVILNLLDVQRRRSPVRRRAVNAAAVTASCVLLVGNVAAGLDEDYRFPGPYVFGSDTRSITPELVSTADWFRQHIGTGQLIVTDRYTGLAFVRDADAWTAAPSAGFPTYDLYFHDGRPSSQLVRELSSSRYAYLVVDQRMATELPAIGVFFEPDEPFAYGSVNPVSTQTLVQYENYPWTTLIFQSDDYAIYRFDFGAIAAHVAGSSQ